MDTPAEIAPEVTALLIDCAINPQSRLKFETVIYPSIKHMANLPLHPIARGTYRVLSIREKHILDARWDIVYSAVETLVEEIVAEGIMPDRIQLEVIS